MAICQTVSAVLPPTIRKRDFFFCSPYLQEDNEVQVNSDSYSILTEFDIPMKVVRLTKIFVNEICKKVIISKHLYDTLPIQNGLKQGDALLPLLFNCSL
jgi:hypothetical protein